MKAEDIYDGITGISDDAIKDTGIRPGGRRRMAGRIAAIAAAAVLVVGLSTFGLSRLGGNASPGGSGESKGSGHDTGNGFMSYAGPVLPLTLTDSANISATRRITLDFAPEPLEQYSRIWSAGVTDGYTLSNDTSGDITATLAYPFVGSFRDLGVPVMTVNGETVSTRMHSGPYTGGFQGVIGADDMNDMNLRQLTRFSDYAALLSGSAYMDTAFTEAAALDIPVTVYKFTQPVLSAEAQAAVNPTLCVSYGMDYDKTVILAYGFNGGSDDPETGISSRHFSVARLADSNSREDACYIVVIGDDIFDMSISGYEDGGCDNGEEVSISVNSTRYSAVLDDVLHDIVLEYYDSYHASDGSGNSDSLIPADVTFEPYYNEVRRFFMQYDPVGTDSKNRYNFGMLEDIISETAVHARVFYLTADVTIPAGGSISVSASFRKLPSYDFYGAGSGREDVLGFDTAVSLGSCLRFTELSAELVNYDGIEIVNQNYGFDIASGVTSVTLSTDEELYYLEITVIRQDEAG